MSLRDLLDGNRIDLRRDVAAEIVGPEALHRCLDDPDPRVPHAIHALPGGYGS